MNKFINKAIDKSDKLSNEQLVKLIDSLKEKNNMLESVVNSSLHGMIVIDLDNRIKYVNKAAYRMMPHFKHGYMNRLVWDVVLDSEIAGFVEKMITSDSKYDIQQFVVKRNNEKHIFEITVMPIVEKGAIVSNMIHLDDVTELRKKEVKLDMAEKLASMTTLTASVAHEIKNPLGSISIYIQLIQKALGESLCPNDNLSRYINVINEEVDRLNSIVVDFLFAVKPVDIHKDRVKIETVINEIVELVKYEFEQEKINITVNLAKDLPLTDIDCNSIKQCFLNIIKNAASSIEQETDGEIYIDAVFNEPYLEVSFTDNGKGISKENMVKIFEPYFTTKDTGTGLGLTIVYKIIKEHGGDIKVESNENSGTTFTILLPAIIENKKFISRN